MFLRHFIQQFVNTTFSPANFLLVWSIIRNSLKLYFYARTPPLLKYGLVNKHNIATVTIKHIDYFPNLLRCSRRLKFDREQNQVLSNLHVILYVQWQLQQRRPGGCPLHTTAVVLDTPPRRADKDEITSATARPVLPADKGPRQSHHDQSCHLSKRSLISLQVGNHPVRLIYDVFASDSTSGI